MGSQNKNGKKGLGVFPAREKGNRGGLRWAVKVCTYCVQAGGIGKKRLRSARDRKKGKREGFGKKLRRTRTGGTDKNFF